MLGGRKRRGRQLGAATLDPAPALTLLLTLLAPLLLVLMGLPLAVAVMGFALTAARLELMSEKTWTSGQGGRLCGLWLGVLLPAVALLSEKPSRHHATAYPSLLGPWHTCITRMRARQRQRLVTVGMWALTWHRS